MSWSKGYTTDIQYLSSFHNGMAPAQLQCLQTLAGFRAHRKDRPFRCLELGAGSGVGLSVLAAANPKNEFVGIDYNPGHIHAGQSFMREAGIDNLALHELDFLETADKGAALLGKFDFIICHGVYSWIAPELRSALIATIDQCIAPGGVIVFGYNSLPGWTMVAPMQKMLREHAVAGQGRSDDRLKEAFRIVVDMANRGAKFLDRDAIPNALKPNLENIEETPAHVMRYLVHEYCAEHWTPMYHMDVAEHLSAAKLNYLGSGMITDHFLEMVATKDQQEFLAGYPQGPLREQIKDYFTPQMYRRDLFARGATPISDQERSARLSEEILLLRADPDHFDFELDVRVGKVELPKDQYQPIVELLAGGPQCVGDLVIHLQKRNIHLSTEEIFGILVGSQQATCVTPEQVGDNKRIRLFNKAIAHFALNDLSAHNLALAAERLQNGVQVSRSEFIFAEILCEQDKPEIGPDFAPLLLEKFHHYGEKLIDDGEIVTDPERELEILKVFIEDEGQKKLHDWTQMGIL